MASSLRFVDSIASSPMTRLDLNDRTTWRLHVEGTEFPPPPLDMAIASTLLSDGGVIPAAAYGLRTLTLLLSVNAATADAAATQLQNLYRELDRPRNILRWEQETTNPVFFRTFRASADSVEDLGKIDGTRKLLQLSVLAEPFAYGLVETPVSGVTVSTDPAAVEGLFVPGVSGAYASTPDHSSLDITGDIDLRAEATTNLWQDSATGFKYLVAKYNITGNQRSYALRISTSGFLNLGYSTNGTDAISRSATALLPITSGRLAVRATFDVNDGGGNNVVRFYYADSISGPWTQLGDPVTNTGTVAMHSGTAILEAGAADTGTSINFGGTIHAAEIRNGIDGTIVANPNFAAQSHGATSFADSTGKTWTVNGGAKIVNATGCFVDVTGVKGDVEAPAIIRWPGVTFEQSLFASRRRGTPSAAPVLIQAESMTQSTDTATQSNDAAFSGAGNNYSRTTFSTTATEAYRLTTSVVGAASADLRGTYRVFMRYRKNTGSDGIRMFLRVGDNAGSVVIDNEIFTTFSSNAFQYADLGLISLPMGTDPGSDSTGSLLAVSNGIFLAVRAERTSGSGTIDFDFLLLVPADDRLAIVEWRGIQDYVLNAADTSVYGVDGSGRVVNVAAPRITGGLPMLTPNQVNRIYMIPAVNRNGIANSLTTVSPVSVSYHPRYLSVRPAST